MFFLALKRLFLAFPPTLTAYFRGDGAVVHNGSADLRLTLLLSEFLKEGEADRKHQYGGNDAPHGLFAFFPVFRRLFSLYIPAF